MARYDSEAELKTAVEKELRWRLSPDQWDQILDSLPPLSHSPYDDRDAEEHVEIAKTLFAGRPAEEKEQKLPIRPPESHITVSGELAQGFELKTQKVRDYLGLDRPLNPGWLEDFLKKFKPTKGDELIELEYQKPDGSPGGVTVQSPESETRQRNKLLAVKEVAESMAKKAGWDPAEATNFILCGQIPTLPYLGVIKNFVYGDTPRQPSITLTIHNLNISGETVRGTYLEARNQMLAEYEGRQGKESYKPRPASKRVLTLLDFASKHKDLSWEKRCLKWNKEKGRTYGTYANHRSMQTAYSQARKRLFS